MTATRKRELAKQIRETAMTLSRDILRERVIREAEELGKEAVGLEIVARVTRH